MKPSKPKTPKKKAPVTALKSSSINFDELYEKVKALLDKDKENFELVAFSETHNYFVIVHKKTITTKRINENSVFQPVTFEKTQEFPIPFILWISYTKDEPEFIKQMKRFSTTVIRCLPMDDFKVLIEKHVLKE